MGLQRRRGNQVRTSFLSLMPKGLSQSHQKAPPKRGLFFWRRWPRAAGWAICLACLIPFLPGLAGPFLLDDWGNLDALKQSGNTVLDALAAALSNPSGTLHRPIANLTLAINLQFAGLSPFSFKLFNLLLHLLTGIVAFLLGRRLLALLKPDMPMAIRSNAALLGAVLWIIHPLQVSTVYYVVQRMAILSGLFSMLAVHLALGAIAGPEAQRRSLWRACLGFFAATLLAVLSKENGALTPLLLSASLLTAQPVIERQGKGRRQTLWILAIGLPLAIGAVLLTTNWSALMSGYATRSFTLTERLLTEACVLAGYLRSVVLPHPHYMGLFLDDTTIRSISDPTGWIAATLILGAITAAILARRRYPLIAFAILWFFFAHAMESTILPLELAFEHRNYVALFGPALAAGMGITTLAVRQKHLALRWIIIAIPLMLLATATWKRSYQWGDEGRFALTEVANHPDSIRANDLAGAIEAQRGDIASFIHRMQRMKQLYPAQFHPYAMDMDFACYIADHPVQWKPLMQAASQNPRSSDVLGHFNQIVLRITHADCRGIDADEMDAQLSALQRQLEGQDERFAIQYLLILRATLAEGTDVALARQHLAEAAAIDPHSAAIWERTALFELTHDSPKRAIEAIKHMSAAAGTWSPARQRARHLRMAAEQALRTQGSGDNGTVNNQSKPKPAPGN